MPGMTSHPSREQLSAYNLGQLTPAQATAVECHLSECEPCCDTVLSLSADDTFVGLLRESRQLVVDPPLDHARPGAKAHAAHADFHPEMAENPRYELVRLIGKGGMGDVYEAVHRKMERRVALKVINRELFQKAEVVNRFHREVKTAAQFSHPNIVTSHDADQAGDLHFLVMEYVDGVDLSQMVKDQGALPIAEACDYIRQAATGLQHAHERNMVHRDIKPHNLMVTAEGTVKILDFGLASLAPESISSHDAVAPRADLTAAGAIMGTPDFISPEQAHDARRVDIRSDIYSLGATLYYLLAGRAPFDDGSLTRKLTSHTLIEPAPVNAVRSDVPAELAAIVSRMMAKYPDERYLTPKEVAEALESFLQAWRPESAASQGQEPPSCGSMSVTHGRKYRVGGARWPWWLVTARMLLAIACIPVSLIFYEAWIFDAEFFELWRVRHRVQTYLLAAICLSTVAGIGYAIHRSYRDLRRSRGGDRYIFGVKVSETLAVAAVFLATSLAAGLYYAQANKQVYVRGSGKLVTFVPPKSDESLTLAANATKRVVELWIEGEQVPLVRRGAHVRLRFEGWPTAGSAGWFRGQVMSIAPNTDGAGMFRVLVREYEYDHDSWPDERYLRPGVSVYGQVKI